jgi:hypothetical protein
VTDADGGSSATRDADRDHETFHELRTLLVGHELRQLDRILTPKSYPTCSSSTPGIPASPTP